MKKKTISITKEQLSKVMHNCISTAIDNFIERKEKNNVLDEVPTHMYKQTKLRKKHWVVICQTMNNDMKHSFAVLRNVIAIAPEKASRKVLNSWETYFDIAATVCAKIICVVEDIDYEEQ